MKKERLKWIDALRGYGALAVLMCHLIQRLIANNLIVSNSVTHYLLNGARAVQLFFIISGLTTFLSLDGSSGGGYKRYVIKRYLSIFPHYILAIVLYYIVGRGFSLLSTATGMVRISFLGIVLNVLGLNSLSATFINSVVPGGWYIGVIWIYYLIAPLIYKIVRNTDRASICVGVALLIRVVFHLFCSRFISDPLVVDWADMWILNQFVFIAIGQFLYFVLLKQDTYVGITGQVTLLVTVLYVTFQKDSLIFWALIFVVLIYIIVNTESPVIVNRFALIFGKYSLELYLLHNAVLFYVCNNMIAINNSYIMIGITFIVSVILTFIFGVAMNKSISKIKEYVQNKRIKYIDSKH